MSRKRTGRTTYWIYKSHCGCALYPSPLHPNLLFNDLRGNRGFKKFRLEETPRLKKLKKLFEKECAPHALTRAPILNIEELSVIFPQSLVIIAVIGTLTAARVGNLSGFRSLTLEPDSAGGFTWRYKWVRHKTLGACGARVCKLHLLKRKIPVSLPEVGDHTVDRQTPILGRVVDMNNESRFISLTPHTISKI
jgi:hypothetical protein